MPGSNDAISISFEWPAISPQLSVGSTTIFRSFSSAINFFDADQSFLFTVSTLLLLLHHVSLTPFQG